MVSKNGLHSIILILITFCIQTMNGKWQDISPGTFTLHGILRWRGCRPNALLLNLAAHCVRRERGSIVIVTRDPLHPALVAVHRSSPADLLEMQAEQRRRFGFPPFGAVALVGGPAGKEFMNRIPESDTLTVLGNSEDSWLIRAADRSTLCSILNAVQRPPGRLKLQVDPISV